MTFTTLDKIVRGVLLQKRWPIHFYIECLTHAQRCLEELHFDTLGNVRSVKLALNSYNAVTLPCDYMDYCEVGIPNGPYVQALAQKATLNRLNTYDADGNKTAYDTEEAVGGIVGHGAFVWFNENQELTGRMFGSAGDQSKGFKLLKERNEIQFDSGVDATHIILTYISDGSESDNATQVNPYAKSAIESWIFWKYKENARSYSEYERTRARRQFDHDHMILRGRLNKISIKDIKSIFNKHAHGSIKG